MAGASVAHDQLRPLMFSIAYRMLGSVVEAEDVVQEAHLRIEERRVAGLEIENPAAYASTVTTRIAIDALRSARRQREVYVGPWMPEPLPDDDADPAHRVERDETLSFAFLAVLERLGPVERAVFLLREVFAYDYAAIAEIVGRDEVACRQILHRAKARIAEGRPRFEAAEERDAELTDAFFAAVEAGNVDRLVDVLADDVVFYGDGGGRAPAIREPMHGALAVARFLGGLVRRGTSMGVRLERRPVNGAPALWVRGPDGALLSVLMVQFDANGAQVIANQLNPEKLTHLGPVGDLYALMGGGTDDGDGPPA
ncbi:RNA polymerase sigma-70 factor [Agromyces sp. ISL-38]|uniref:RNA polymerase sigma-70 factor n=1 Tax=Agromyces sp. ISL-38 TaxID=2819107 RepID=UPI001BEACBBC|nr:RNA polymerase sigma-70 factor [Agromyces sp. ISL-38]MBT2499529.1 RNA polymerase sigma-70 factor [Agromyces sp. ISL-38]MBT2516338.1 RNA polymerase sigma-70 factor [Streptomyces sp. ISL-90]